MSRQVSINGKLVPKEKAMISVFDHGLLYGDGVFEGLRSYGGTVFRLEKHVRRLYESALSICLDIPQSQAAMCRVIAETVTANTAIVRKVFIELSPLLDVPDRFQFRFRPLSRSISWSSLRSQPRSEARQTGRCRRADRRKLDKTSRMNAPNPAWKRLPQTRRLF